MNFVYRIPPENVIDTYKRVKSLLGSYETIIFSCMKKVNSSFELPTDPSQYTQKHKEIESIYKFASITNGIDNAFRLMEEIWKEVNSTGGIPGVSSTDLLNSIMFQTLDDDVIIRLTEDGRWALGINVFLPGCYKHEVILEFIDRVHGDIVPQYVIENVISAIYAFRRRMYTVTSALLSIAVEATLRDILAPRGYTFSGRGVGVDVYKYTTANVGVNGNSYTVTFQECLPKSISDFPVGSSIEIKIRRYINKHKNRTDLYIVAPQHLIDHWSSNVIETHGRKTVGGLGEALEIARNELGILTPYDLPLDFDPVITAIRNNLIHLSGDSLNSTIKGLNISLNDFLKNDERVFDLVTRVPYFINEQYVRLRTNGNPHSTF